MKILETKSYLAMTINDIALEHVYDFMEKGSLNNAPQEIVDYLQMLDKIRGMFLRIDTFGLS